MKEGEEIKTYAAAAAAKRAIENPLQLRITKGFQVDYIINF